MTIQEVIKKIDRYLKKDNVEPLIVDVQNKAELDAIMPPVVFDKGAQIFGTLKGENYRMTGNTHR